MFDPSLMALIGYVVEKVGEKEGKTVVTGMFDLKTEEGFAVRMAEDFKGLSDDYLRENGFSKEAIEVLREGIDQVVAVTNLVNKKNMKITLERRNAYDVTDATCGGLVKKIHETDSSRPFGISRKSDEVGEYLEILREEGVSIVRAKNNKRGKKAYSLGKIEQLFELYQSGVSLGDITKKYKLTSARKYLIDAGVYVPGKRGRKNKNSKAKEEIAIIKSSSPGYQKKQVLIDHIPTGKEPVAYNQSGLFDDSKTERQATQKPERVLPAGGAIYVEDLTKKLTY